jgi:precorrin-2 dehydrogenase / sirohydrochlorin ferrochelatase
VPVRALPIQLDVRDKEALVIGSGPEVGSKIERLLSCGARVTVVTETPDAATEERARGGQLRLERRAATDGDLEGKLVVFVAPGDDALGARLYERATREGRLLCTIDRPDTCTFTNVAVIDKNGLVVTVTSEGASPGAVRRIREDLERVFGDPRLGLFLAALRRARAALPLGERARSMSQAVRGFGVEATLRFPSWFGKKRSASPRSRRRSA